MIHGKKMSIQWRANLEKKSECPALGTVPSKLQFSTWVHAPYLPYNTGTYRAYLTHSKIIYIVSILKGHVLPIYDF